MNVFTPAGPPVKEAARIGVAAGPFKWAGA
jgi:hypothetical protein